MRIPRAIRGPLLSLLLLLVCGLVYWFYFDVLAPYSDQRSQDRLDSMVSRINQEGFTAQYCQRFNGLSKTYSDSYLSDKIAFELKNQIRQQFPQSTTPEQGLAFMKKRLYALDLHFATIFNYEERREAGLSPAPHSRQRTHRRQFMSGLAVLSETFAKAHMLDMNGIGEVPDDSRLIAIEQVLFLIGEEQGQEPLDGVEEMIRPLLVSIDRASAGLLAFDVIDVEFMRILYDLDNLLVQGFREVERSPFEVDLALIKGLRSKSLDRYRAIFRKILAMSEVVAIPGELGFSQRVSTLCRAGERTLAIATIQAYDVQHAGADDDLLFIRNMRARVPHKALWFGIIERDLQGFWSSCALRNYLAEQVQEFPGVFGTKSPGLAALPAEMAAWFREQPQQINPDIVNEFIDRIQAVLQAELEQNVTVIQARFQGYQGPNKLHFTPGTAKRAYANGLSNLHLLVGIQQGTQSVPESSLRELREAYRLLSELRSEG